MKRLLLLPLALLAACSSYDRPSSRITTVPEPAVRNSVDSIPRAAEVLVGDMLARSKITQRIRVAFLPADNRVLDPGVSDSISNSLMSELVAHDVFQVLKDIDLKTVISAWALEDDARAFLDPSRRIKLGRHVGADAVITCTISDSIQFWQIHVDLTAVTSNVVASSATCYLPKRIARRSQIYQQ